MDVEASADGSTCHLCIICGRTCQTHTTKDVELMDELMDMLFANAVVGVNTLSDIPPAIIAAATSTPEALTGDQLFHIDDVMLSAINFGYPSVFGPHPQRKKSLTMPKCGKKPLGFVELLTAPDTPEDRERVERGLNFALTPRNVPHIDFLIEIENAVRTLPLDVAEEVRQDCFVALRYAKPPKLNIPKAELLAFNNLMHNNDLIISRADKGNATVIMSKPDYLAKMEILLSDSSSYKILSRNPCPKILKAVRSAISNSSLDDSTKLHLLPSKEVTPRIYGVPKIHKANIPLRPIVDTIGSPTYKLAAFLAKLISLLVGNSNSFIKDSNQFVQFIKDTNLDPQDTLVSFDVVSLFTKVPILDSIEIVKLKVNEEIASLVELCLRSTFFAFQGIIYEQVDGVAMGSPLSPVIANIFMEHFEEVALHSFPLKPKWWKRYMDDTKVCWPHGLDMLEEFHTHLNNIFPSITFTKELESNNRLSFLDVLICKKPDGSLGRQVFRKTTHTDLYLHSSSHHHHSQKVGILKTLALRAHRICDKDNLDQELSHLRQVFLWNGYSNK
ncbi:uncharacterized protein LOC131857721 [Cryptomeria japonica]|uniref:uncharacterized protein LOC131857721 n=1 Tax=Cryptomeria japonica TaxID=3369 RepID=UPI0027DA594F|nr:uncharacterized protein LOC131857721 [Cryptomeria japonica]